MWLKTIILSVIMMLGLFLMLWGAVGFVQDKKFFTSAPKMVYDAVEPKNERFKGQHAVGYIMIIISLVMLVLPIVLGIYDGIKNNFTYFELFFRLVFMTVSLKVFDILFFDLYLLCHSGFFSHYYPEVKKHLGQHLFGYNIKEHLLHILICVVASIMLSFIAILV